MSTRQQKLLNVLVLGDACVDKYHYGVCERLSPEAPVPVLRHNHTEERQGMCLNVSNNLSAFGVRTTAVHNTEMIFKERFVDLKTKHHLLRGDFGENAALKPLSATMIRHLDLTTCDAVVISDYNKGFITHENASQVAQLCIEEEIPLFVDSKKTDLSCFENAIIKINKKEYERVATYPEQCELVVTLGADGAQWKGTVYETEECEVFDVSGAGDTFLAALVYEYLVSEDLEKAVKFANICSRIVVQKFGTYCLNKEDVG